MASNHMTLTMHNQSSQNPTTSIANAKNVQVIIPVMGQDDWVRLGVALQRSLSYKEMRNIEDRRRRNLVREMHSSLTY